MATNHRRPAARLIAAALAVAIAVLGTPGLAAAEGPAPSGWRARPATFGVKVEKDVKITLKDGTILTADVRRPANFGFPAAGRFPVIVSQTAYNKNTPVSNFVNNYLVKRGYVQVVVDIYGTGGSNGVWNALSAPERAGFKEVVDWAASSDRPWSNGRIGLSGCSYGATSQLFAAAQGAQGVKAMIPVVLPGDAYRDFVFHGGGQLNQLIGIWATIIPLLGMLPPTYSLRDPVRAGKAFLERLVSLGTFTLPVVTSGYTGGDKAFDSQFWRDRSSIELIDKIKVPTFLVGGQYDVFQRGAPAAYKRLVENGVPARFVQGPWAHLEACDLTAPLLDGEHPAWGLLQPPGPTLLELELRWFDHYVRGDADPALDSDFPPVTYYEIGSGKWDTATQFPPADVRYQKLSPTGPSPGLGRPGQLTFDTPTGGPDVIPWNPLAGLCSKSLAVVTIGIINALPCEADHRWNDLTGLTYDLPVTDKTLRFAGPMNAHLTVSTEAKDGQLSVRLEDVAPNGKSTPVANGWQALSLRKLDDSKSVKRDGLIIQPWHPFTKESVEDMPKGQPVAVDVEIWPSAGGIQPGHKLRLAIQTLDLPHLFPPIPQLTNSFGQAIKLYHDAANPSWIALPVRSQ